MANELNASHRPRSPAPDDHAPPARFPIPCVPLGAALAGPEHAELRKAFARWLRRSWDEDYDLEAGADDALRGELDRLVAAGEVEAMGSLTAERWKERQRQKEAQIRARAMAEGVAKGVAKGRAEGLEYERRLLASQAARGG